MTLERSWRLLPSFSSSMRRKRALSDSGALGTDPPCTGCGTAGVLRSL